MTFSERLDKLASKHGGLRKLAIASKIPYQTLYDYKTKNHAIKVDHVLRLCGYTGCSVDWLLTGKKSEQRVYSKQIENDISLLVEIMESEDEDIKAALRANLIEFRKSVSNNRELRQLRRDVDALKRILNPVDPAGQAGETSDG